MTLIDFAKNKLNFDFELALSVAKSFLLHFSLVFFIYVMGRADFKSNQGLYEENIQLVEASVRVDMVAMPVETLQELQALSEQATSSDPEQERGELEPEPEPEPAPVKEISEDVAIEKNAELEYLEESEDAPEVVEQEKKGEEIKRQEEAESFLSMLQQTGAREASTDGDRRRVDEATQRRIQDLVARGNKISEGVALVGGSAGAVSDEFVTYLQRLPEIVRPHWRLPSYLANEGLQSRVRIYLAQSGRLIRAEIYETSNNEEYDRRAIEAVRNASPFPELEESFAQRGIRGDIVLGFPL